MLEPPAPRDHHPRCPALCEWADASINLDPGHECAIHDSHECTCDEIAAYIAEKAAEAIGDTYEPEYTCSLEERDGHMVLVTRRIEEDTL